MYNNFMFLLKIFSLKYSLAKVLSGFMNMLSKESTHLKICEFKSVYYHNASNFFAVFK